MTALRSGRRSVPDAPAAGRVGRRRPLPTGRAVAGGFFVALAAVLVFAAWLQVSGHQGRAWVVAARDLPAGTSLSAGDLTTATMQLPGRTTARQAFNTTASVAGRVLDAPVRAGELLQGGDLSSGPGGPGLRPVTVDAAPTDVVDVAAGTEVDVLVTDGSDPSSPTVVVVTGARVLAVQQGSASLVSGSTGAQLTLGVTTLAQVTAIVHAAHTGTVSVVVGSPGDQTSADAADSAGATGATGTSSTGASSTARTSTRSTGTRSVGVGTADASGVAGR